MAINLACESEFYNWQVVNKKHFFDCANLLVSSEYTNQEVNLFYYGF